MDRLTQKFRVRPQTLWLELAQSEIQGTSILHITASGIPDWVARMWTVALRRIAMPAAQAEIGLQVELASQERGRLLREWLVRSHLERWYDAIERFLHLVPPPRSGYDLRHVRERQTSLTDRLLSLVKVELAEAPTKHGAAVWFDPAVEGSTEWLVLALSRRAQLESALLWLNGPHDRDLPNTIVFVVPPDLSDTPGLADIQRTVDVTRSAHWLIREQPANGPAIVVGSGAQVCMQWQPGGPVLHFAEGNASADWLAILKELPQPAARPRSTNDAEPVLRQLRSRRRSVLQDETATLGRGAEAYTVAAAIDALGGLQQKLLTAMVDPEFLIAQLDFPGELAEPGERGRVDLKLPLAQQLPFLVEECDRLVHELALAPAAPWAFTVRLSAYHLIPVLTDVLSEPDRRASEGEICILAHHLSEQVLNEGFLNLLREAILTHGWTVTIALSGGRGRGSPDVERVLSMLQDKVASPRLCLRILKTPPPAPALIIDDLVFLAAGDWVGDVLTPGIDTTQFGMAIESGEFAATLRAYLLGAEDFHPSSWATV